MFKGTKHLLSVWQSAVAAGCVAVVLFLACAVVRTDLHEAVHHGDHSHEQEHSCPVHLLAQGLAAVGAVVLIAQRAGWLREFSYFAQSDQASLRSPHLLPPGRGPPPFLVVV